MTRRIPRHTAAALLFLALSAPLPAAAAKTTADRELRAAEQAYRDVDLPGTLDHAIKGLAAGGSQRGQVARLSVLVGMSAAALERGDEARSAFIAALALDPSIKLDKALSPKLRGPYLEAQGYWSGSADRLSLRASAKDGSRVTVHLVDPATLVAKITLGVRAAGESRFQESESLPDDQVVLAVPPKARGGGFDYFVRALDAYGNVLAESGTEDEPVSFGARAPVANDAPAAKPRERHRSYLVPVTLGALGLGAAAAGVVFHLKREDSARTWNGPGCERPGSGTREQQCGGVDEDIRRDERIAVVSYAVGGVLLTTSVVTWLAGVGEQHEPKADTARAVECGVAGTGLACAGTF